MEIIDYIYRKPSWLGNLAIPKQSIDTIGLHHTSNNNSLKINTDYQMNIKKWAWCGYSFYITKGKIYRIRGMEHQDAGIKGHNNHTVNIAIEGNYDIDKLSDVDRKALEWLIGYLKKENDNIKYLKGHNFFNNTSCPGKNIDVNYFAKFLEVEKENVEALKLKQELINEIIINDSLENEIKDLKQKMGLKCNKNSELEKENKLLLKLYKKYRMRYKELYAIYQKTSKELREINRNLK